METVVESGGERITVEDGRKAIVVVSWGQHPLGVYLDKQGRSFVVPHKYTCKTKEARKDLIGEAHVDQVGAKAQFRFSLADGTVSGDWKDNPTAALDNVQAKLNNKKHRVGANGLLVIGFKYPALQKRIKEVFSIHENAIALPPHRKFAASLTTRTRTSSARERILPPFKQDIMPSKRIRTMPTDKEEDIARELAFLDVDIAWMEAFFRSDVGLGAIADDADMDVVPPPARLERMSSVETLPMMCSSMSDDEEPASDIGLVDRDYDEDDDEPSLPWRKKESTKAMTTTTTTMNNMEEKSLPGGEYDAFLSAICDTMDFDFDD